MPVPLHPLEKWLANVALAALSSRETVEASYRIARMAIEAGVPGDFCECGVFGGAQSAAMARAIVDDEDTQEQKLWSGPLRMPGASRLKSTRRVHLFDTFAGIPQSGPHDLEFQAEGHTAGLSACSVEGVKAHMAEWGLPAELFVYHEGLFSWGVGNAIKRRDLPNGIAVLRLDGDLYESTKDALGLLPLVSRGGWVIVDDWKLSGARKAIIEHIGQPGPIMFQKHKGGF